MAEGQKPIKVRVRDRDKVVYEGEVVSLSSVNNKGRFDILPQHAHFITLVNERLVLRQVSGEEKTVNVSQGVMRVKDDAVQIYLGV